jgi:hypothetical protein
MKPAAPTPAPPRLLPLRGSAAIGRVIDRSSRTVLRLFGQGKLPGVHKRPGAGKTSPLCIDRGEPLDALRRRFQCEA